MSFINLDYFKNKLLKERERIIGNIRDINAELATIAADDNMDDVEDMAELNIENKRDKEIAKILMSEVKEINDTLKRIEEGTYGIDEVTKKPIPLLKLLANPTLCKIPNSDTE